MKGKKKGSEYLYVEQLGYDKFEQRVFLQYGNGLRAPTPKLLTITSRSVEDYTTW
jgi:hypothetical protein